MLKQIVSPLNSRLNYTKSNDTREWVLATVAGPGSGKTFFCYYLLKLAMSGSLGSHVEHALGTESENYQRLLGKLNQKIVGLQVNCNDGRDYNEIDKITAERDTCLRLMCSYYLKRCSDSAWKTFYKSMSHLMPPQMERIIELILMDWEEQTGHQEEQPFVFICFDESSKITDNVINYLSTRNSLIEHFEHVDLPEDGNLNDLRKIKIINLVTALVPTEVARKNELGLSQASNRLIKWITLPNLRHYIEQLIPQNIMDTNSRFYYRLGLYWTNGNPRQIEKLLNRLQPYSSMGKVSGTDLMHAIKEISAGEWKMREESAWKFVALPLSRLSVGPDFYVTDPHRVRDLFLASFYTSSHSFPLVELYLDDKIISECITSKLYLQSFVSNQLHGAKNIKIISFIKKALELETVLEREMWEPYLANIFAAQITCWSFILSSSDFMQIPTTTDNVSNINFHRALQTGCLPLSQLFHYEPTCFSDGRGCGQVMINLKLINDFDWEVIDDFDPETTRLKPGGIYLPKNPRTPGWDVFICFLNEDAKLSAVFFQLKDLMDGNDGTIGPLPIGKSICQTIGQIENIRVINNTLEFINCYYILFSRKRAPNFNKWKEAVSKKQGQDLTQEEQNTLSFKNQILGGYFCVDAEDRNTCLGQTLSTFICRPTDSEQEICRTRHNMRDDDIVLE